MIFSVPEAAERDGLPWVLLTEPTQTRLTDDVISGALPAGEGRG